MKTNTIDIFNVLRQVKVYWYLKKIEKHFRSDKAKHFKLTDLFIIGGLFSGFCAGITAKHNPMVSTVCTWAAVLCAVGWYMRVMVYISDFNVKFGRISRIVLKDDQGKNITDWQIAGASSLIIGKGAVDIDLTGTAYACVIGQEHAALNFFGGEWFVEDIGSSHGTGIKKNNTTQRIQLESGQNCKLEPGDMLYIADAKLAVY